SEISVMPKNEVSVRRIRPVHPGMMLRAELEERNLSLSQFAQEAKVPLTRVRLIASGRRAIDPETAILFGRYFGTSAEFWLNFQSAYDLRMASEKTKRKG